MASVEATTTEGVAPPSTTPSLALMRRAQFNKMSGASTSLGSNASSPSGQDPPLEQSLKTKALLSYQKLAGTSKKKNNFTPSKPTPTVPAWELEPLTFRIATERFYYPPLSSSKKKLSSSSSLLPLPVNNSRSKTPLNRTTPGLDSRSSPQQSEETKGNPLPSSPLSGPYTSFSVFPTPQNTGSTNPLFPFEPLPDPRPPPVFVPDKLVFHSEPSVVVLKKRILELLENRRDIFQKCCNKEDADPVKSRITVDELVNIIDQEIIDYVQTCHSNGNISNGHDPNQNGNYNPQNDHNQSKSINRINKFEANRLQMWISRSSVQGGRDYQEDRCLVLPHFGTLFDLILDKSQQINCDNGGQDVKEYSLFAVYDGHDGSNGAEFALSHLHYNLIQGLQEAVENKANDEAQEKANQEKYETQMLERLKNAFLKTNEDFLQRCSQEHLSGGTTAVVCLLKTEEITALTTTTSPASPSPPQRIFKRKLWASNCGDSRAFICKQNGKTVALTHDHKAEDESERQRIISSGGIVVWNGGWRVNGKVQVTRSIGDPNYSSLLIADPYLSTTDINEAEDLCLVIASDGLSDVLTDDEVGIYITEWIAKKGKTDLNCQFKIAKSLTKEALKRNSKDNISVVVVFFQDLSKVSIEPPPTDRSHPSYAVKFSTLQTRMNEIEELALKKEKKERKKLKKKRRKEKKKRKARERKERERREKALASANNNNNNTQ